MDVIVHLVILFLTFKLLAYFHQYKPFVTIQLKAFVWNFCQRTPVLLTEWQDSTDQSNRCQRSERATATELGLQVSCAGHGAEVESRQEKEGWGWASQVLALDPPCEEIHTVTWWRGAAVNCQFFCPHASQRSPSASRPGQADSDNTSFGEARMKCMEHKAKKSRHLINLKASEGEGEGHERWKPSSLKHRRVYLLHSVVKWRWISWWFLWPVHLLCCPCTLTRKAQHILLLSSDENATWKWS